jgi:hypothetical protein
VRPRGGRLAAAAAAALAGLSAPALLAGCGERHDRTAEGAVRESRAEVRVAGRSFPTLENVRPTATAPRTYDFMVMLRTPYASIGRYAAGWRVLTPKGEVVAVKRLSPYLGRGSVWRRHGGVRVPPGVRGVQLEARDSRFGYGGPRVTVTLP